MMESDPYAELNKRLDTLQDQVKHQQKWQDELDQQLKEITDTIRALTEQPSRKRKTPDTVTDHEQDTQPLTQEEDKGTMTEIVEDLVELGKDVVKHLVS